MATMSVTRSIAAPPGRVWEIVSDLAGAADRLEAITKIEILTEGPIGVGTRWRETRRMGKREATETMEITAFDPPRSYTAYADSCGCDFRFTMRVEPEGDGARLAMDFESKARTFLAKLMTPLGWLMKGYMRKCMDKDFDQLQAAAEQAG